MTERRIGQSVCAVCGKSVRPGGGTVLRYGASGRVHTIKCLAVAQRGAVMHSEQGQVGQDRPLAAK
jgi:hypothetical protein